MFIGEYTYSIDEKKRLSIPSKFRDALGKRAVITKGNSGCLVIYPLTAWSKEAVRFESMHDGRDEEAYSRLKLAGAIDVDFDKMGRILVPEYLKSYASLKKNVTILGLSNKIEVWDELKWKAYRDKMEKEMDDIASRLQKK